MQDRSPLPAPRSAEQMQMIYHTGGHLVRRVIIEIEEMGGNGDTRSQYVDVKELNISDV